MTTAARLIRRSLALVFVVGVFASSGRAEEPAHEIPGDANAILKELAELGVTLDLSAYEGLPREALVAVIERMAPLVRVASNEDGASAARRHVHVLLNYRRDKEHFDRQVCLAVEKRLTKELQYTPSISYPEGPAISRPAGDVGLRVVLVPRRRLLDELLNRFRRGVEQGGPVQVPHAGTLWFEPLSVVEGLDRLYCPGPTNGMLWGVSGNPDLKTYVHPAAQGKVVSQGKMLEWARGVVRQDGPERLIGSVQTYLAYPHVYFARYESQGEPMLWTWAIPLVDANGGARWVRGDGPPISAEAIRNQYAVHAKFGSRYENAYGGLAWKHVGRHNLLVLPKPRPVNSGDREFDGSGGRLSRSEWAEHVPQERLAVTRELVAKHPILVLRKGKTWHPFMEDADFDTRISFHERDADTALVLVLSADATDKQLREAVQAYYGVSAQRTGD